MADSDHVQVNTVVLSAAVASLGFKKPLVLSHNADFEGTRTYNIASSIASVLEDFDADTPEAIAARQIASQTPHPPELAIGKASGAIVQKYELDAVAKDEHDYRLVVSGEGFDETEIEYTSDDEDATQEQVHNALLTDLNAVDDKNYTAAFTALVYADKTFTAGADDIVHIVGHDLTTGDGPFRLTTTLADLPLNLLVATDYWWITIDDDTGYYATSLANALDGVKVDIADGGSGVHTLSDTVDTKRPSDPLIVTGNAIGDWFAIESADVRDVAIAQTHADFDVDEDLADILNVDKSWYWIVTLYNSKAYSKTVAQWAEANGRAYTPELVESAALTEAYVQGDSTDAIAEINDLGLKASLLSYHGKPAQMMGAALTGLLSALPIGKWTAADKTLVGVTATNFTSSQRTNLTNRRGNGYEVAFARSITFDGMVGNTIFGFLDNKVGLDALAADLAAAIFGVKVGANKIAATREDLVKFESAARAILQRYSSDERPVLKRDENLKVIPPTLADFNPATRTLSNVGVLGALANAVQHVIVGLTVTN